MFFGSPEKALERRSNHDFFSWPEPVVLFSSFIEVDNFLLIEWLYCIKSDFSDTKTGEFFDVLLSFLSLKRMQLLFLTSKTIHSHLFPNKLPRLSVCEWLVKLWLEI